MTVQKYLPHVSPMTMTTLGIEATIQGPLDISEGNFKQGIQKTIYGLASMHFGASWMGSDSPQILIQNVVTSGVGIIGAKGCYNLVQSILKNNTELGAKGFAQGILGIGGFYLINALDSKALLAMHQLSLLVLSSYFISKSGLKDINHSDYRNGIGKIVLAFAGLAFASYYLYNEISSFFNPDLSSFDISDAKHSEFLSKYKSEIEQMFTNHSKEKWEMIGEGVSKKTFTHTEAPDIVVKFPFWNFRSDNDIQRDYESLQRTHEIFSIEQFPHLRLPKATLVETTKGSVLLEEKFNLIDFVSVPKSFLKDTAMKELDAFIQKSGLCDVVLSRDHNAAFLEGSESNPIIGIFDFDCYDFNNFKETYVDNMRMFVMATKISKIMLGNDCAKYLLICGLALAIENTLLATYMLPLKDIQQEILEAFANTTGLFTISIYAGLFLITIAYVLAIGAKKISKRFI